MKAVVNLLQFSRESISVTKAIILGYRKYASALEMPLSKLTSEAHQITHNPSGVF